MTTKPQPQGKGEMRCEMCFKKLDEEVISIGCHRGEKMSKFQVTTTTSQQQQQQDHLICKECAEIITEFTRKKKKEESGMSEVWKTSDNSKEWICWSGFIHKSFAHQNNNHRDGRDLHIL